jgi:hypothetical protein
VSDPTVGSQFTLTLPGGLGRDVYALPEGLTVTVEEVVEPLTSGVAVVNEPTVLVSYSHPACSLNDLGDLVPTDITRHTAFALSEFNNLFTAVA